MLTLHLPRFYIFERCSTFSSLIVKANNGFDFEDGSLHPSNYITTLLSYVKDVLISFVPYVLCPNGTDTIYINCEIFTSKGSCITLPHSY